jgi:multiple sugar transport system substrate-binding protein
MKSCKRIVLLSLIFISFAGFAFAQAANEENTMSIDFWHHYSAESAENKTLTEVLIPEFEKQNPGISVNAVPHEWAELHNKILISTSSKSLPDVARLDIAWVPEFQKMGILVALDREIDEFEGTKAGLLDSAMSTANVNGHYYALALNTNSKIIFYNEKMLKDAGIAIPKTTDELVNAIRTLSKKNANGQQVWGWNEPALSGWNICPFIWTFGGALTNEDQTVATGYINSDETIAAIQTFATLCQEGCITGYNSGDIPMTDGFGTYRYAMMLEGPWKSAELAGAYPTVPYGTTPMPQGKGGSISVLGGEDIAMFSTAEKDPAWEFMQFMTSEFAQTEMAKCGQIPVNKKSLESDIVKAASFAPFLDAIKTAKARPTVATWSEIDNELTASVHSVVVGEKSAKQAMDELAVKMDALLKK